MAVLLLFLAPVAGIAEVEKTYVIKFMTFCHDVEVVGPKSA